MLNNIYLYKFMYGHHNPHVRPTGKVAKFCDLFRFVCSHKFAHIDKKVSAELAIARQFMWMEEHVVVRIDGMYVYPFDTNVVRCMNPKFNPIASTTVDYGKLLTSSLSEKKQEIKTIPQDTDFAKSLIICLDGISILIERIKAYLLEKNTERTKVLYGYFERMQNQHVESFDEAVQRILFYNSLFWQNKHKQNGIGRMDLILNNYYEEDIAKGIISRESAKELLFEFVRILGKDQDFKGNSLIADTGQVIILGGIDRQGNTVENVLTHIFLEIFDEKPVPDPKLILRVNRRTSEMVWRKAIDCILKGSGSPLIMNENVIIPRMIEFGYDKEDVWNVGTSACWEPLIIGKSLDQNNCIKNVTILDVLIKSLYNYNNESFDEFLKNVDIEIAYLIASHCLNIEFDRSPLLSLYFDDCIKNQRDFGEGGAKYNYHGLLVAGLPNLINSILNIKTFVYDKHLCSIEDCKYCIDNNYTGREDLLQLFRQAADKFGSTKPKVVDLTNHIMEEIGKAVEKRTMFGKKVKVGFSSPSYIGLAKNYPASLDGRRADDPFATHISPVSSHIDIAEILDFASQLKYDGCCINGNVVDFIVPLSYAKKPEKLSSIVKHACDKGLFELQLNVLDRQTLIDAKANPEKYPNLIVRVWGFSAYFNDLPEEYKDNLIARAETYNAN